MTRVTLPPEPEIVIQGFVPRRNWYAVASCGALAAAAAAIARTSVDRAPYAVVAVGVGVVFAGLIVWFNGFPLSRAAQIRASRAALRVDGGDPMATEEILEVKASRRHKAAVVDLTLTRGRKVSLRMAAPDAAALIRTVGARRTSFTLVSLLWKRWLLSFGAATALTFVLVIAAGMPIRDVPIMLPALLFYAPPLVWLLGLVRGRLVVGADGFTTRWMLGERFVAFRDVARFESPWRVSRMARDTVVELRSGKKLRLRPIDASSTLPERGAESSALVDRLTEALAAWQAQGGEAAADVRAALQRHDRAPREWLASIDGVVRGGYRVATVPVDALTRVVGDATAPRDARVGAAVALVRVGSHDSRRRVRVAAEACAEPELRAALLQIADADGDAPVVAALARLRA